MPITFLRLYRLSQLVITHIFFFAVGIGMNLLFFLDVSVRRRIRAFWTMIWARTVSRILGIHVRREGNYSSLPYKFMVSNHISYIDILVLAGISPSVFISKHEVRQWPVIGLLARLAGTTFINRASKRAAWHVLSDIEGAISGNVNVIVFPEGTTTDGSDMMAFRNLFFHVPVKIGVPVIPVSLRYFAGDRNDLHSPSPVAWYGDMDFMPHFWKILGMRSIQAVVYFNPVITEVITGSGTSQARKLLSLCTRESIRKGLSKIDELVSPELVRQFGNGGACTYAEIQVAEEFLVDKPAD